MIDVYNPMQRTVHFSLTISVSIPKSQPHLGPDSVPRPFQKRITIAPGQHRESVPYVEFRDIIESGLPYNIALTPQGADGHHVVFINLDLVKLALEERKNFAAPTKAVPSPPRVASLRNASSSTSTTRFGKAYCSNPTMCASTGCSRDAAEL